MRIIRAPIAMRVDHSCSSSAMLTIIVSELLPADVVAPLRDPSVLSDDHGHETRDSLQVWHQSEQLRRLLEILFFSLLRIGARGERSIDTTEEEQSANLRVHKAE